jgi:hypothetical protein
MPKYIGYGFECDPVVCHSCGQGVTEDVRAGTMNRYPGTLEKFLNEGADADGFAQWFERRVPAKEQFPMSTSWPRLAKVQRQYVPDFL